MMKIIKPLPRSEGQGQRVAPKELEKYLAEAAQWDSYARSIIQVLAMAYGLDLPKKQSRKRWLDFLVAGAAAEADSFDLSGMDKPGRIRLTVGQAILSSAKSSLGVTSSRFSKYSRTES